jgi:hypothetical protein
VGSRGARPFLNGVRAIAVLGIDENRLQIEEFKKLLFTNHI